MTGCSIQESSPNQSSFWASRTPSESYSHSIESIPYSWAYDRTLKMTGSVNVNHRSFAPVTVTVSARAG